MTEASKQQNRWGLSLAALITLPFAVVFPSMLINGWPWLTCVGAAACLAIACATRRLARAVPIVLLALHLLTIRGVVTTSIGERVTSASADGVIVGRDGYGEATWIPSRQHVEALETDLPAYLRSGQAGWATILLPRLREYKRQYAGINAGSRRVIVVQFVHASRAEKEAWLKWCLIKSVMGGGADYWHVEYDPATRTFAGFWVNAPM